MKLTDLILILRVKRLQAVINGNKPEMDETGSETEIKYMKENQLVQFKRQSDFILFIELIMVSADDDNENFH